MHPLPAFCAVVFAASRLVAADLAADLDRQLAREPAKVVTTAGRTMRGLLDGFRDGRLHLRLATDGGEVGYSFAPTEIRELTLPGGEVENDAFDRLEAGEVEAAMPLLEALGRQRIRYLPVLQTPHQRALWTLVSHADRAADPHTVRAIVRALTPLADTDAKRLALLEAGFEASRRAGDDDEALRLALLWCALADPAGGSARGWSVLAEHAYASADYERTRWIALVPITLATRTDMRDLDRCYALAIAAAERQGDCAHAGLLRAEMAVRGLAWPAAFDPGPPPPDSAVRTTATRRSSALSQALEEIRKLTPSS